jgi:Domain of unknown function (DUF4201)
MVLRKHEGRLRAKEQLAEGLHLIDFEQLKIENQTLNEKVYSTTAHYSSVACIRILCVLVLCNDGNYAGAI